MINLGQPVTAINALARKIQALSADGKRNDEVYELATQLIIEAQHIREMTQQEANKWPGNQKQIGVIQNGSMFLLPKLTFLKQLLGFKKN